MNGVAEALLQDLIDISRNQEDLLRTLAARSSGTGGSGGGGSGGGLARESNLLTGTFSAMGRVTRVAADIVGGTFNIAMGLAAKGFQGLTQAGNTLWQNQMRLAEGAIEGTNSLSSLTAGLENLPFGLGLVAQAMNYQTRVLEKNIATFQAMSQSGATLGGNLDEVRRSAAGMYLSMDEFSKLMQESTAVLRYLGGTSEEGARNLIKFNTGLIQGNVGRQLLGMGYTIEEVNGLLGSYASVVGGVREADVKNQKRMEQSVKNFAQELDLSAQLEGKTRKQKEEELKKAAAQAAVEAKLAGMTQEQKDKYAQALAAAQREGQGAVDALHSEMLGFPPMTKAAQMYTAVVGEGAAAQRRNAQIVNDNSSAADARSRIDRNAAAATAANIRAYEQGGAALQAATFGNNELATQAQQTARSVADSRNKGIKNEDDALKRINETRAAQERAQQSGVGATVQAQGQMKHFGGLMEMLSEALAPLFPVVESLIRGFAEILPKVISFGGDIITKIIIPLFQDLFGGLTLDDVLGPFKDFFKGLFGSGEGATTMESVRKGLSDFLKPITTFIGDIIKAIDWQAVGGIFRTTFQTIGNVIQGLANIVGKIFGGDGGEFGKGLQDTFERLASIINRIVDVIGGIVDVASSTPMFDNMKKFFLKLFDVVLSIVEVVLNVIESPIGKFVITVLGKVINAMFEVFNAVLDAVMGVVSIVEGIFDILSGDFSEGLSKIFGGIGDIIGGVVDFFGTILSTALSILGDALSYIAFLVVEMVTGIWDWFTNLGTLISETLSAAWEWVIGAVTGMVNAVINGFVAIKDGIINFFNGGYETFLSDIWESVKSIISSIVDGIKNIGSDIVNKVLSWGSDEEEQPAERRPTPPPAQPRQPATREPPRPPAREPTPPPAAPPQVQALGAGAVGGYNAAANLPGMTGMGGPGGTNTDTATLNTNLQNMIRNLREISDNTKRTADLIASNGNLFRR